LVLAEQLTDAVAYHGEGPVWSEPWGGLRWVDMLAGDVLSLEANGAVRRRPVASVAAAIRPRRCGGMVIGTERGFTLEAADGTLTRLGDVWDDGGVRMNEGACDPDGHFWCGSMAYDQRPGAAALYRLDADLSVHVELADVTVSNGLDWTPDGTRAYYDDTATLGIDSFEYDADSGLSGRARFVDLSEEGLRPDGLTVDAEGGVWVALSNGSAVRRYGPDGRLEAVVELPVTKATACTFGGARLDRLYITTSREGLQPGVEPRAGSLFAADVAVRGQPVREFAG
jgi:sugar lactone lactonase YvrE